MKLKVDISIVLDMSNIDLKIDLKESVNDTVNNYFRSLLERELEFEFDNAIVKNLEINCREIND